MILVDISAFFLGLGVALGGVFAWLLFGSWRLRQTKEWLALQNNRLALQNKQIDCSDNRPELKITTREYNMDYYVTLTVDKYSETLVGGYASDTPKLSLTLRKNYEAWLQGGS